MATKSNLNPKMKEFTDEDLAGEVRDLERQYQKLQFDHAIRGLDRPITLREIRRDIARLKTEIRLREVQKLSSEEVGGRSKIRFRRRRVKNVMRRKRRKAKV